MALVGALVFTVHTPADTLTHPTRAFGYGILICSALSPDGTQLATGTSTGLYLRDVATSQTIRAWEHTNVISIAFSPDGRQILACSGSATDFHAMLTNACLFDVNTGILIRNLDNSYNCGSFSQDGSKLITGRYEKTEQGYDTNALAVIWDAGSGTELATLRIGAERLVSTVFSPDGTKVMTAGSKVRLWDTTTGSLIKTIGATNDDFTCAALSPDGTQILTAGPAINPNSPDQPAQALVLWDAASGQSLRKYIDPDPFYDDWSGGGITAIAFSSDGQKIAVSVDNSWDYLNAGYIYILNTLTGAQSQVIPNAHFQGMSRLAFNSNDSQIISTCPGGLGGKEDNSCKRWNLNNGLLLKTYTGYYQSMNTATISGDGNTVLTGSSYTGPVCIWDATTAKEHPSLQTDIDSPIEASVRSLALADDGSLALVSFGFCPASIIDTTTGYWLRDMEIFEGGFYANHISTLTPDGRQVVMWLFTEGQIKDAKTGGLITSLTAPAEVVATSASFDGSLVVTANKDQMAYLYDGNSGTIKKSLPHQAALTSVAISADGQKVVTGSTDGIARMWDTTTGHKLWELNGNGGNIFNVAISSNGTRVATCDYETSAKVWDGRTGQLLHILAGHPIWVTSVSITADGTKVLTSGSIEQAYLWDLSTAPLRLAWTRNGDNITLTWAAGILQSKPTIDSTWEDVAGAASPYNVETSGAMQFFRLR